MTGTTLDLWSIIESIWNKAKTLRKYLGVFLAFILMIFLNQARNQYTSAVLIYAKILSRALFMDAAVKWLINQLTFKRSGIYAQYLWYRYGQFYDVSHRSSGAFFECCSIELTWYAFAIATIRKKFCITYKLVFVYWIHQVNNDWITLQFDW